MEEKNQQTSMNNLCPKQCGFYGSQAHHGLCSLCNKKLKEKSSLASSEKCLDEINSLKISDSKALEQRGENKSSEKDKPCDIVPPVSDNDSVPQKNEVKTEKCDPSENKPKKPTRNACATCNVKLGLFPITCHCSQMFCPAHLPSNMHNCQFDFHKKGQEDALKALPKIVSDKVAKI